MKRKKIRIKQPPQQIYRKHLDRPLVEINDHSEKTVQEEEMVDKSSFPYRKYDRKPHPYIVKQILEDHHLIEMMKEVLIQEGKACPFCHRKLKGEQREREIW